MGSDINSANRLSIICLGLPNIKHCAENILSGRKPSADEAEMMSLIRMAITIDKNLEQWTRTLPEAWDTEVSRVVTANSEEVAAMEFWPGPVYTYRDLKVANILNDCRIFRIFCQSIVLGCIAALPTNLGESDYMKGVSIQALYILRQAVNDICWSIPYLLGFDYYNRPDSRPEDAKGKPNL